MQGTISILLTAGQWRQLQRGEVDVAIVNHFIMFYGAFEEKS